MSEFTIRDFEVQSVEVDHGAAGVYCHPPTIMVRQASDVLPERVDHPAHYGGADNPYEAIKVIEAWELGFCLGNTVKYISRAGKKGDRLEDLKKAAWYLQREIERCSTN